VHQDHHVRVLFQRPGLPQVREHRPFVRDHGHLELLGQQLHLPISQLNRGPEHPAEGRGGAACQDAAAGLAP